MENGYEMINKVKVFLSILIMIYMMDFGEMVVEMDKEHIIILMVINMLVFGLMIKNKEKENYKCRQEIIIVVNG